jgi:predicted secreted protein
MAKYTGSALTVSYNSSAWNANHVRSVTVDETADVVDSSGAGDTDKTFLATLKAATAQIEMIDDSDNATVVQKFEPGTSSTLTVTKAGTETLTGTAIVTSRSVSVPYDGLALVSVGLQFTGGMTTA